MKSNPGPFLIRFIRIGNLTGAKQRKTYPLKDEAKVLELQANGKTIEALVESILVKARNKEGKRLFQDTDRTMLMNESDPTVVVQVATQINNARLQLTQEQAAKE